MKYLSNLTTNTRAWQLLALTATGIELTALFFQYAMGLAPCIMCVYQRLAMWSIIIAGVAGAIGHQYLVVRLLSYFLWGTGAIWGLLIAIEHVEIQSAASSFFYSCEFIPNFPTWAPLHEWMPFMFEATGDCGEISWQFLGYSMPQWMIFIYACYSIAFVSVLLSRLLDKRTP